MPRHVFGQFEEVTLEGLLNRLHVQSCNRIIDMSFGGSAAELRGGSRALADMVLARCGIHLSRVLADMSGEGSMTLEWCGQLATLGA
eukprot:s7618_g1.t1